MATWCVALAVTALGGGDFKNGRLTDPFWGLTYTMPSLAETAQRGARDVIFAGHLPGGLQMEISVRESAHVLPPSKWRSQVQQEWARKKPAHVTESAHRLLFTVRHLGVFDQHHGYAFHVRGNQCFVVHAWFGDRTDTSGKQLLAAVDALKLGPDPGCGVRVLKVASRLRKGPTDPHVLLEAGAAYLGERDPIPAVAARLFARARKTGKFDGKEKFRLNLLGGRALSIVGRHSDAIAWLQRAEQIEVKEDPSLNRTAAYELACACSVANRLDDGFAALHRAFRDDLIVGKGRLSQEKALGNLRKDTARWEKFWKACVQGK